MQSMYVDYFGLDENPFTISPNPKYLYMSTRHQEALAHLLFGVQEGGGFVQLTGEVGTGKTTLTRALLEQLPENVDPALIFNPKLTALEFLAAICDELRIDYVAEQSSVKSLVDALNSFLLTAHSKGRRVVLIVDEAQNFHPEVLEQIRLLTNLETTQQKLLQIILVGQPELRDLLARKELRQLAQRITARYHLVPMTYDETKGYIKHRLKVAGARHELFSSQAMRKLWKLSSGVPRLVNILADRCLLAAYASEQQRVNRKMVKQAYNELNAVDEGYRVRSFSPLIFPMVLVVILFGAGIGYQLSGNYSFFDERAIFADLFSEPRAVSIKPKLETEVAAETALKTVVLDKPSEEELAVVVVKPITEKEVLTYDDFLQFLQEDERSYDLTKAFEKIFSLWRLDFSKLDGMTGCEKAMSVYKRCYWGDSNWQEFVKLNHPAIIWLPSAKDKQKKHYFVVNAIRDDVVHLSVAARDLKLQMSEFEKLWPKRYLTIWQPPSVEFEILRPGDKGKLILSLRRNIDSALGLTSQPSGQAEVYDVSLRKRVETFQSQQGLKADGLVGELTMLHLNSHLMGKYIPLLTNVSDEDF